MSDILGMLQEVDLLTDGVSLSSLNRAAALKLGDEFEKYVKEKSQEMIESAKVVTKYGNPPLLPSGKVNPWPLDGLWELAAISFITSVHRNRTGNCGHKLLAASSLRTIEGSLRSAAYLRCPFSDDDCRRNWAERWVGKNRIKTKSVAVTAIIRKHTYMIHVCMSTCMYVCMLYYNTLPSRYMLCTFVRRYIHVACSTAGSSTVSTFGKFLGF